MTRNLLFSAAAVLALGACAYGGEPLEEGYVPPPDGQYDYLEGQAGYQTPEMTEREEELVENAGEVSRDPAYMAREEWTDPVLGEPHPELFDEEGLFDE